MLWHDPSDEPTYSQVRRARPLDRRAVARRPAPPAGPRPAHPREDRVPRRRSARSASTNPLTNGSHDKAVADTFPASDPTTEQAPGGDPRAGAGLRSRSPSSAPDRQRVAVAGTDYELEHGSVVIAAITSCTNTSNPQVMVGAGLLAKKAVERGLQQQAVGEDEPRAGLEGRDRVLRPRRPDAVPRAARLPHRRLRLHDLHRQLRPAAGGDLGRRREGRPRRLLRPLRQPQLRGADPPRGEGELPRLAAARRRLRARRPDGPRPARGAARRRTRTATTSSSATSGRPRPRSRRRSRRRSAARCSARTYADVFTGDEQWRELPVPEGELFAWEHDSTYVRQPPYFDEMPASPAAVRGHRRRPLPRHARRLGHDRPHLAGGLDQARLAGRHVPASSTASSGRTSTRTARAAATTR